MPLRSRRLFFTVDDETVEDVDAQRENGQRPPWVCAANRQQRLERAEGRGEDSDEPAVTSATKQREAASELNDAHDDRDPAPRVQAREHVLRVVEEVSVANRP